MELTHLTRLIWGTRSRSTSSVACLICGVDSGPIRNFLIVIIGSLVMATLFVGLWAWTTGRLRLNDDDSNARLAIAADEREEI